MTRPVIGQSLAQAFFLLCAAGFIWYVREAPFFWDTIQLGSKHAHFFYENGCRWQALPPEIDSGHPPLLGIYLAKLWSVFGKQLEVGHWAMLPFLWAIVVFLYRIGRKLGGPSWAVWLLPLALTDPVLLGQSAVVGPDLILAAFFLCSVDALLGRNRMLLAVGIAGLCAVSMRGMMCSAALFTGMLILDWRYTFRKAWMAFLPGFALAGAFLAWHYSATGWIGYHAGSPWAPAFRPAGAMEIVKNAGILAWRWLDFGRFGDWIFLGVLWWKGKKNAPQHSGIPVDRQVLVLFLCLFVFLNYSALRYNNLSAHRYFLPLFLMFHFIVFQWIVKSRIFNDTSKKVVLFSLSAVFALSNFQVYPHGISMDWDSSLAHIPYHEIRAGGIEYLKQHRIPLEEVGTAFPNINTDENVSLNGDLALFAAIDTTRNKYIFISNVFNDVSKSDRKALQHNWYLVWQEQKGQVWGEIYKKSSQSQ